MPHHAGFAVAIAVRAGALNESLRRAYKTEKIGHFIRTQQSNQPIGPFPRASLRLFFQPPELSLSQAPVEHATLRVTGWGTVTVRLAPFPSSGETREIQWEARLVAKHEATLSSSAVNIKFKADNYQLFLWQFDILSGTLFSAAATAFLNGEQFKTQLEGLLRQAIRDIDFPVDVSFFGQIPAPQLFPVVTRSVPGALMVGVNAPLGAGSDGDPLQLQDFAGGNDIALYVNSEVLPLMLLQAQEQVAHEVAEAGATLDGPLEITAEEGKFRVRGKASRSEGSANFSFSVIRQMVHTRPGKTLWTVKGPVGINTRTWKALSFRAVDPSVDIDRDGWVVFGEIIAGIISLGGFTVVIEAFIAGLADSIGGQITSAQITQGGPIPLVRRTADPVVRVAVEAFDIHADGVFVGITSQLKEKPALLSGMKTVPRNFANRQLRYDVRLPFDALPDDPFLRIRWTAIDLESGSVLVNDDAAAFNRLSFRFNPGSFGVQSNRFAVVCRVYRTLGPFSTELLNETFKLDIGPPVQPGAFVRWRYDVKNPQIALDVQADEYSYVGDAVVRRWSKFHRTDKPCNSASDSSRYIYELEVIDDLPFPIHDMLGNRYRLCDYCFFGGPASLSSSL
jgi:hypothetical protein